MFRSRKNTRAFAKLLIALLVLWQGAVLHHMLVTPHYFESATHTINHSCADHSPQDHSAQPRRDSDSNEHSETPAPHQHCPFLDSITSASVFVTPAMVPRSVTLSVFKRLSQLESEEIQYSQQLVFEYAPSTSPPTSPIV